MQRAAASGVWVPGRDARVPHRVVRHRQALQVPHRRQRPQGIRVVHVVGLQGQREETLEPRLRGIREWPSECLGVSIMPENGLHPFLQGGTSPREHIAQCKEPNRDMHDMGGPYNKAGGIAVGLLWIPKNCGKLRKIAENCGNCRKIAEIAENCGNCGQIAENCGKLRIFAAKLRSANPP